MHEKMRSQLGQHLHLRRISASHAYPLKCRNYHFLPGTGNAAIISSQSHPFPGTQSQRAAKISFIREKPYYWNKRFQPTLENAAPFCYEEGVSSALNQVP